MRTTFACSCGAVYVASGPSAKQKIEGVRHFHQEADPRCREVTLAEARKARQKAEREP